MSIQDRIHEQKAISKSHVHVIKVTNSIQLYIRNKIIIRS